MDKKHGFGKFVSVEGTYEVGNICTLLAFGNIVYNIIIEDMCSLHLVKGFWRAGKKHGKGTMTFATGDVYEGEMINDLRHGKGTYKFVNGDVYTGQWEHHKKHGR